EHMHVNMRGLNFTTNDGVFKGNITVIVQNKKHLHRLIENLKKINGIDKVIRL
ncbi:MAG: ACT domain-containing protein, partial [Bacteroidota bacterium]|nr:ACT domain-containing protein [Bacteroidota bacterium]